MFHSPIKCVLIAMLLALPIACAPPSDGDRNLGQRQGEEKVFTEEEQRIARTLSIGEQVSDAEASPREESILCDLALTSIEERMQNSGVLSVEQRKAFASAQAYYRRRAASNISATELHNVRKDVEASYPEPSDRARFAMECLRDLS